MARTTAKKKAKAAGKKRATAAAHKSLKTSARKKSVRAVGAATTKAGRAKPAVAKKKSVTSASKRKSPRKKTVTQSREVVRGNGEGAAATSLDPVQFPEKPKKKIKTPLTAKQLREFKALLEAKRAELCGDVQRLTSEALHKDSEGGGDQSTMPIHMADRGSDNWEQDFTLGLIANEEAVVREIDEALARIKDKTYGVCLATQNPIGVARLRAKPWAKYGIEYARMRDEGRLR